MHNFKWPIFVAVSIAIIVVAILLSKDTTLINQTRTVQPPPSLSSPTESSISGTVNFDSTSTNSFNLDSPSKVHIDFQAGHYGVGATITDSTSSHLLDLSFSNISGQNNPSGEFTGNPGTYNVILSGPSSFAVSDVGKPVSFELSLTTYRIITYSPTTEIIAIHKSVRNWSRFYLISVPGLVILLPLVLLLTKHKRYTMVPVEPKEQAPTPHSLPLSDMSGVPPSGTIYVDKDGTATATPPPTPPKSQQERIKEARELAFRSLQSLLGNGLLKDAAAAAKFHESISRATSEEDLQEIVNTLGAIGAGQSFDSI